MNETKTIELYTSIEEAKEEMQGRWNNAELRRRVSEYLGDQLPISFRTEPRATLFRHVIILDTEFERFFDLATRLNIKPIGHEYLEDKFCTSSADKLRLGRIDIFSKFNKKNEPILRYEKIIDFNASDGRKINEVNTLWDQKLVDFFHNIQATSEYHLEIVDMSEWCRNNGDKAVSYYVNYLALFVCHGVLLENFINAGEEASLVQNVIYPAFEKISNMFGVKPLIVELFSEEEIARCDQYYFHETMRGKIDEAKSRYAQCK
jgi:hypothetical protein